MGLSQSYLSQSAYGYDMVVSVTQKGLNNAIETYYNDTHTFKPVSFYFTKNTDGTPLQVDQSNIISQAGIDPLSGTATKPLTQDQINALKGSNLWFAFSIYIGNPPHIPGTPPPNYLIINPGSNTVDYYLLCRTLHVAFWNPDNNTWVEILQTKEEDFKINATVNLHTLTSSNNITEVVQNGISYIMSTYNLSSTDLNIQQLLFDADSAVVSPTSTLTGLDSSCSVFASLMQQFAKSYFSTYLAQAPALDYAVTQNNTSSLLPTCMSLFTGAFVDGKGNPVPVTKDGAIAGLSTINYLFSTNGDALNAGKQFNWNYLDDNGNSQDPDTDSNADVNKYDGVIAINRHAFANYFHQQLKHYVLTNCYKATGIKIGNAYAGTPEYTIDIDWFPYNAGGGVQPLDLSMVGSGPDTLLSYGCSSMVTQEGWAEKGSMTVNTLFGLTLQVDTPEYGQTCSKNLILTQEISVFINSIQSGTSSNPDYAKYVISKTYVDTFTWLIDNSGNINLSNTNSQCLDYSDQNPPEYIIEAMVNFKNWNTAAAFTQVPVTMPRQFVFPGGNAFALKDAQFSAYSDAVCHIKYQAQD